MTQDNHYSFVFGGPESFSISEVEIKGQKEYIITGYISTDDLDLVDDIVTKECLDDMARQINEGNIKLDVDHEAWKKGEDGPNILPIGRILEAKNKDGRLWVKALINQDSKRFDSVWKSIKNKFLDAFSIAFKPVQTAMKEIEGKQIRLLQKIQLLNVALTGNPANPSARIDAVMAKSLNEFKEVKQMAEEIKNDAPQEEVVEQPVEEPQKEEQPVEEKNNFEEEVKSIREEFSKKEADLKEEIKSLKDEFGKEKESLVEEIKSLKETLDKPAFKSLAETVPEQVAQENNAKEVNPLDRIGF